MFLNFIHYHHEEYFKSFVFYPQMYFDLLFLIGDTFIFCLNGGKGSAMKNHTRPTEFILLGLSDDPELQTVIFLFLIITYILSVTGNLTIIILTLVDSHLQTPMYFFLRNFSILEISFTKSVFLDFWAQLSPGTKRFHTMIVQLSCFSSFSWVSLNFIF